MLVYPGLSFEGLTSLIPFICSFRHLADLAKNLPEKKTVLHSFLKQGYSFVDAVVKKIPYFTANFKSYQDKVLFPPIALFICGGGGVLGETALEQVCKHFDMAALFSSPVLGFTNLKVHATRHASDADNFKSWKENQAWSHCRPRPEGVQ